MRTLALFLNGNYESNLEDIVAVQSVLPEQILFIQPYAESNIVELRNAPPSVDDPVILYASTTTDLNRVHYTAEIVGWEDKSAVSSQKREVINKVLGMFQPDEGGLYEQGKNLLYVRRMRRVEQPFAVSSLIKISNNEPVGERSTAGGWSYVYPLSSDA